MTDRHLTLLQGTKPPDTPAEQVRQRVRKMDKPAELVQCHRCGGREVFITKIGMVVKAGKLSGGTRVYLCAGCFMKGERVVLTYN